MSFNRVIEDLNIIQKLADRPNEDNNLTADELKAMFDKGVNILKEYVFSFLDELEGKGAADNIGYNGAQATVGAAIKALESAGVGTIPPDNTITTDKLQDGAVTGIKLATDLLSKINATKIKVGTITPTYTGSNTTDNGASGYVTEDKWQEHQLTFAPSAVLLFKTGKLMSKDMDTSNYYQAIGIDFGNSKRREGSSYSRDEYTQYGGLAMVGSPCLCGGEQVFKIDGNKLVTRKFTYNNTDNSNTNKYTIGTTDTLYYIAIA